MVTKEIPCSKLTKEIKKTKERKDRVGATQKTRGACLLRAERGDFVWEVEVLQDTKEYLNQRGT